MTCGQHACMDGSLTGDVTLAFPACCAAGNACGVDVSETESVFGFTGCVEVNKRGQLDPACADLPIEVAGQLVKLPGCCQANGRCGGIIDVTAIADALGVFLQGPDFGCQSPMVFGELDGESCGK